MRLLDIRDSKTYREQSKTALLGLLAELPNLIASIVSAILANTLLVWSDCYASLESTGHYLLVHLVSKRLSEDTGDRYNFGTGRVEALTSFVCDLIIVMGYVVLAVVSIYGLFRPTAPEDELFLFLILKAINISVDVYFYVQQMRLSKHHTSRMNDTELANARDNLIVDAVTGVIACLCYFLRAMPWSWYISPAATLVMTIVFFVQTIRRIMGSVADLSDASISVEGQDEIFDMVLEYRTLIQKIRAVNCRMLNHRLHVDIELDFKESATYAEQETLLNELSARMEERYPGCVTRFVLEGRVKKA